MNIIGRFFLAAIAFAIAFWLVAALGFSLLADGAPEAFRKAAGVACGLLAGIAAWRATAAPRPGLAKAMLQGAGLLGLIGFIGGFAGPMIFAPQANQGPLLGIFITGPGGFLLGAIAGALWWKRR